MLLEGIPKRQEKHMSRNDFVFEQLVTKFLLSVNRRRTARHAHFFNLSRDEFPKNIKILTGARIGT